MHNDRLNHPYTLRFNRTSKEIVDADISQMDFIKFLKKFAGYIERGEVNGYNKYLYSNDSTFTRSARNILIYIGRRGFENEFYALKEYSEQFECWKKLPKDQKAKLLEQVIIK